MDIASVPGSSSWLTSLPIAEHGFCLHKGAFADALALRYGWAPSNTPAKCVCVVPLLQPIIYSLVPEVAFHRLVITRLGT